jgi:hypothetical protein
MSTLPVTDSEVSLTKAQWFSLLAKERGKGYRPKPIFAGTFSDGTRYVVYDQSQSPVFYLVTDLVRGPYLFRVGSVTVTIGNGVGRGTASVTLSPALDNIANYKASATVNDVAQAWSGDVRLTSTTVLNVAAYRSSSAITTTSATTGVTVAGNDLTDVSGMTTDPVTETVTGAHGADAGFIGHGHTTAGHPVTDPGHSHLGGSLTYGSAVNVNVDWQLIHI